MEVEEDGVGYSSLQVGKFNFEPVSYLCVLIIFPT